MKLLLPFGWLYALVVSIRNKLFDWVILRIEDAGVPVISVGNLTVGGTGKTPLVEYILAQLLPTQKKIAVVSRGYKRESSGVVVVSDGKNVLVDATAGGDEPVQIARKHRDAIVVVGEKRVEAARKAVALGAEAIILDDGFQHRYLKRDLDILVIDSTSDITRDAVIPAGRLREPLSGLRRAQMVAFSKCDEESDLRLHERLRERVSVPFIRYRYVLKGVRRAHDNGSVAVDVARRMQLLAFSGIGRHETFVQDLSRNGFAPVSDMRFSDHHEFSVGDVSTLTSFAKAMGVDACITTEKDFVRLRGNHEAAQKLFDEILVLYLVIEVEMIEGREALEEYVRTCINKGNDDHRNN